MRLASLLGCIAVAGVVVGACGQSDPGTPAGLVEPSEPLYSEAAAAQVAGGLLARVPLPANTVRVSQQPAGTLLPLGRPQDSTDLAKSVDRHAYWISTERPPALLAVLAAHGPAPKFISSGYGGARGKTEGWSEELGVPTATPLAGPRDLDVSVTLAGRHRYAVRVDAVVAWHTPRPAGSLVPASAHWLKVAVVEPGFRGEPGEPGRPRRTRSVTTTAVPTVQAVARAVNALPLAEPARGPPPSCPAIGVAESVDRPKLSLTFRTTPAGSVLARVATSGGFVCARAGEATATITTPELHRVLLTDHLNTVEVEGTSLADRIEAALDHRLHLGS